MRGTKHLVLAAAVGALGLTGCSATVDTDALEGQIAQELEAQAGVRPSSVQCPDDVAPEAGATFECTATAEDGSTATITVTQQDDQGNLSWEVTSTG
jgi:outer membrane murein-binding lipoprotein Lpp